MSINHYRSSDNNNIAEAGQMWSQLTMDSNPHSNFNLNHMISSTVNEEDSATMEPPTNNAGTSNELSSQEEEREIPKEPLFQKPLTPSDVGKLNRLVIPKQHAEKYFPLNGDSGEKGLLLSFEDEVGKCWRFRYSYWNSSQSYVLTKGWSRFVKEKKLDAGDVVLFLRHPVDGGRMFIGWRRKGGAQPYGGGGGGGVSWRSDALYHPQGGSMANYSNSNEYTHAVSVSANPSSRRVHSNSKRLRLFGVNLEYQPPESDQSDPSTPVGSPMSTSPGQVVHHQQQYRQYYNYYTNSYYTNINFSGADVYR